MGRITVRRPVAKLTVGEEPRRRIDTLAVEEPLEIRVAGAPLTITMRTPGHDVELAAGFLVSEGVVGAPADFHSAVYCGDPAASRGVATYNVLDVGLAAGARSLAAGATRNFYTTSSCGMCGKASIEAVRTVSRFDLRDDPVTVDVAQLTTFPDRLREQQAVFEKTGGLHAAALFDATSGDLLVLREDVGRHNAVDKVIGWALLNDRLPLRGVVLQVSGRTSFELVQKAVMAGIPVLSAVSAPSSLATELADEAGLTLFGFVRGNHLNVYSQPQRVRQEVRT
ncbi:formate dehydrogenase accessory sulfurtransferase FdhD [Tsukamurella sp. 8F]|uniref:formate dehydrogenase accessory sulfurtransferase FdhD n=1 Tax=unclassified Tsukamurella TaxID=2633480 RepID=UPI0023B89838|nr:MULTISPECIES: formate dehydrogenase accessory sulfurtransferase FdhD [unclassified Tsukamurella]MDF0528723.1 formate dehydrogenase accessory sulfurtransferase FdhD [Tsukamurella sp. 8J]MDF0585685.1 formate dehydrogenase accessory sulfurtransferase FdhD [Tsukamurella sp. 8F]